MPLTKKIRFTLVRGDSYIIKTLKFLKGQYHDVDDPDTIKYLRQAVDNKGRNRFEEGTLAKAKPADKAEEPKGPVTRQDFMGLMDKMPEVVYPKNAKLDELREIYNDAVAEGIKPEDDEEEEDLVDGTEEGTDDEGQDLDV